MQPAFLSTLPARGATKPEAWDGTTEQFLSTLPARGATSGSHLLTADFRISIHAPREGSDMYDYGNNTAQFLFLSTLPARGATLCDAHCTQSLPFLSTLPARGATKAGPLPQGGVYISIHAPREGSDKVPESLGLSVLDFYPRSPRGERLLIFFVFFAVFVFLSTLPARGATASPFCGSGRQLVFLSTLPARGATLVGGFSPYAV